jgi:hypothetical protein
MWDPSSETKNVTDGIKNMNHSVRKTNNRKYIGHFTVVEPGLLT